MVPSTSLTCPKCYKKIPVEPKVTSTGDGGASGGKGSGKSGGSGGSTGEKSNAIAMILAIIPGLFGILGLGLLYKNLKSAGGLLFLVIGLIVFAVTLLIFTSSIPVLNIIFAIPFGLLYGLMYIGNIVVTMTTKA